MIEHRKAAAILEAAERDPRHVLHFGDGQARCALEYRRDHPGCSDGDVIAHVRDYRRAVGRNPEVRSAVARYRADRPGVSSDAVLAFARVLR